MASLANATPRQGSCGAGDHAPKIGEVAAAALIYSIPGGVLDSRALNNVLMLSSLVSSLRHFLSLHFCLGLCDESFRARLELQLGPDHPYHLVVRGLPSPRPSCWPRGAVPSSPAPLFPPGLAPPGNVNPRRSGSLIRRGRRGVRGRRGPGPGTGIRTGSRPGARCRGRRRLHRRESERGWLGGGRQLLMKINGSDQGKQAGEGGSLRSSFRAARPPARLVWARSPPVLAHDDDGLFQGHALPLELVVADRQEDGRLGAGGGKRGVAAVGGKTPYEM